MPLDYVVGVDFEGQVVVAADFQWEEADFQFEEADPEEADFEGQVVVAAVVCLGFTVADWKKK